MMNRRHFLAAGLGTLAAPAIAQTANAPQADTAPAAPELWTPDPIMPRVIRLATPMNPGEIHVDPATFSLLWTLPGNRAIRYAVGIGRGDLYESGEFFVGAKKEWPSWTPTPEMIERNPREYKQWEDGMPGGPNNPLGARALYLFVPGRGDSFLRIHGTNAPRTIGSAVSNGCVRLVNPHVQHLYEQVPLNTRVVLGAKA